MLLVLTKTLDLVENTLGKAHALILKNLFSGCFQAEGPSLSTGTNSKTDSA